MTRAKERFNEMLEDPDEALYYKHLDAGSESDCSDHDQ